MGWSSTTWTGAADADSYQQHADDFWNALNERKQALGAAAGHVPIASANIQSASGVVPANTTGTFSVRVIQNWIQSNCTSFVRSHNDDGSSRDSGYYDGETSIEMWTFANLMKSVRGGAAATSFRRNANDWSIVGKAVEGDRFDAWICQDIQSALNKLIWTLHTSDWDSPDWCWVGDGATELSRSSTGTGSTRAAAKSDAETNWTADPSTSTSAGRPFAQTWWEERTPTSFSASLIRASAFGRLYDIPDYLEQDIDWYTMIDAILSPPADFDDQNDGVTENNLTHWLTDEGNAADGEVTSTEHFMEALGSAGDMPPNYTNVMQMGFGISFGYIAGLHVYGVLRWDIATGFTYQ